MKSLVCAVAGVLMAASCAAQSVRVMGPGDLASLPIHTVCMALAISYVGDGTATIGGRPVSMRDLTNDVNQRGYKCGNDDLIAARVIVQRNAQAQYIHAVQEQAALQSISEGMNSVATGMGSRYGSYQQPAPAIPPTHGVVFGNPTGQAAPINRTTTCVPFGTEVQCTTTGH